MPSLRSLIPIRQRNSDGFAATTTHLAHTGKQDPVFRIEDVSASHNGVPIVAHVNATIASGHITTFIGPSGGGKTTFLRLLCRMEDPSFALHTTGRILLNGEDILTFPSRSLSMTSLRQQMKCVYQTPQLFPSSIFENIAYSVRMQGHQSHGHKTEIEKRVIQSLRDVGLWNDIKDCLQQSASVLPYTQQWRLCLARALVLEPEILLLDVPGSFQDQEMVELLATLLDGLRNQGRTIILATSAMDFARRVSQTIGFFLNGALIEYAPVHQVLTDPSNWHTRLFLRDRALKRL